jgi:hypothetical protein
MLYSDYSIDLVLYLLLKVSNILNHAIAKTCSLYVLRKRNGNKSNVKKIKLSHFYLFVKEIKIKKQRKRRGK